MDPDAGFAPILAWDARWDGGELLRRLLEGLRKAGAADLADRGLELLSESGLDEPYR